MKRHKLIFKSMFLISVYLLWNVIFYVLNINLFNAFLAISYGIFCIAIPGFLIQTVLLQSDKINLNFKLSASLILGFAITLISYFLYLLFINRYLLYLFGSAYILLLFGRTRRTVLVTLKAFYTRLMSLKSINLILLSIIFSCFLIYGILQYPTPGFGPIRQDHHPLSHASRLVSLKKAFPLTSISISDVHQVSGYNTLSDIVGVSFCGITGIPAHLFSIKYNYLLFIPLYFTAAFLLLNNINIKGKYAVYGMALFCFGGEFLYGPMYVLQTYTPQLLGMILYFCILSLISKINEVDGLSLMYLVAIGTFLLVGARLPGAFVITGGLVVYYIFQYKIKDKTPKLKTLSVILLFSIVGFYFFFKYGVTEKLNFVGGQYYVAFSYLQGRFIPKKISSLLNIIMHPNKLKALSESFIYGLYWPIAMTLHFSYMLPVFFTILRKISSKKFNIEGRICLSLAVFAYVSVIFIVTIGGGQYYYLDFAFKSLLIVFLLQIQDIQLFENIKNYLRLSSIDFIKPFTNFCTRHDLLKIVALVWIVILSLPFYDISTGFADKVKNFPHDLSIRNIYASSKLYPLLNNSIDRIDRTEYNYLDKDIYNVFAYIRKNISSDGVIVAPHFVVQWWDPARFYGFDFFLTGFTERTAYLENSYSKCPKEGEAKKRENILWKLHKDGVLDEILKEKRYIFMLQNTTFRRLCERYKMNLLYQSGDWFVGEFAGDKDLKD